jgi:hypothetical protein
MNTCCTITLTIAAALMLSGCPQPVYEKPPMLDFGMSCKQIVKSLAEAHASLDRIEARRDNVDNEDVAQFIYDFGWANHAARRDAEEKAKKRIEMLETMAMHGRCTITHTEE